MNTTYVLGKPNEAITVDELFGIARSELADWFNEELDGQEAIDNDEYLLSVDGRLIQSRAETYTVEKVLRADFIQGAVDIAVYELRRAMERAITRFVKEAGAPHFLGKRLGAGVRNELLHQVRIWYGKNGGTVREVTRSKEITDFTPGDYIMITPADQLAWVANSPYIRYRIRRERGFMARTSRAVRRRLQLSKKTSPITVSAGFSRVIAKKVGIDEKEAGYAPNRYGHPVLYIRMRGARSRG